MLNSISKTGVLIWSAVLFFSLCWPGAPSFAGSTYDPTGLYAQKEDSDIELFQYTYGGSNTPFYVQHPYSQCTEIEKGPSRALKQVFREMYAYAPSYQTDKRIWIYDMSNHSGCKGHPGSAHSFDAFDMGYLTKTPTNDSGLGNFRGIFGLPATPEISGELLAYDKATLGYNVVDPNVFDLERNWRLWKRMIEVMPRIQFHTHPAIKKYMLANLPEPDRSLANDKFADNCEMDSSGKPTGSCWNHQTHIHVYNARNDDINWAAFGGATPAKPAYPVVPIINTTYAGRGDVVFPVRNGAGMFNKIPYYCEGTYTIDTVGTNWFSTCETTWKPLPKCKTPDGTVIPNCKDKKPATRTTATCNNRQCWGFNTTLTEVRNGCVDLWGRPLPGYAENKVPVTCKGRWDVDTRQCNWIAHCSTNWIIHKH